MRPLEPDIDIRPELEQLTLAGTIPTVITVVLLLAGLGYVGYFFWSLRGLLF